jgi:hypothetical protein
VQYNKIQKLIEAGIKEGADLVIGGSGRPEGLNRGYYVRPTVFANVTDDMTIAREEIFGPVLSILPYQSEDEVVQRANDTPYGLASYVQSGSLERARKIAAQDAQRQCLHQLPRLGRRRALRRLQAVRQRPRIRRFRPRGVPGDQGYGWLRGGVISSI